MADEQELDEQELNAILDRLIRGKAPGEILGQTGLVGDLTRRLRIRPSLLPPNFLDG